MKIRWTFHEDSSKHGTVEDVSESRGRIMITHGRAVAVVDEPVIAAAPPAGPDVPLTPDPDAGEGAGGEPEAGAPTTQSSGRRGGGTRPVRDAPQA